MPIENANPIYAIGDIHGQLAMLESALTWIEADGGPDAQIVFLGDYTDRGPNSAGVLEILSNGKRAGRNWIFLKGNHDRMFEWYLETPSRADPYLMYDLFWLHERLGGDTALASYGIDMSQQWRAGDLHARAIAAVPKAHVDFLRDCVLSFQTDDLFFVHAGIRPEIDLDTQDEEDLLWIRKEFHSYSLPHPKLVVHGHTPVKQAANYGNRVNLDSGAGYGRDLTVAVFEAGGIWRLDASGRMALPTA